MKDVELEKANNDYFREWIIEEWKQRKQLCIRGDLYYLMEYLELHLADLNLID